MEKSDKISSKVKELLKTIPPHVTLLAAAKSRTVEEVEAAFDSGIRHFGHNYVQEAQEMIPNVGFNAHWHMIGHLQRNKAGQALEIFDYIDSLDSLKLALALEKRCQQLDRQVEVLIEVNSGLEEEKTGLPSSEVESLAHELSSLSRVHLVGLMTMGPFTGNPELARPYFVKTRTLFDYLESLHLPNTRMRVLSMGMSNSYRVAIEEGANMVRIGTLLFGPR